MVTIMNNTLSRFVSWRTFTAIGTVIVFMGGVVVTLTWGSMNTEHKELRESDRDQVGRISTIERAMDVQAEQLDNIEESVDDLKSGQAKILERLPSR